MLPETYTMGVGRETTALDDAAYPRMATYTMGVGRETTAAEAD